MAELTLMALVLLAGASILWSTLRVGISPMPSSQKACAAVMQLIESAKADNAPIVDLGSGWGSLVIRLAIKYPERKIIGYELSWLPWLVSVLAARCLRLNNLTVHRQNFLKAEWPIGAVLVCYLFPAGMDALEDQLAQRQSALAYLISNNFALPSHTAETMLKLDDFYQSPVYRYQLK